MATYLPVRIERDWSPWGTRSEPFRPAHTVPSPPRSTRSRVLRPTAFLLQPRHWTRSTAAVEYHVSPFSLFPSISLFLSFSLGLFRSTCRFLFLSSSLSLSQSFQRFASSFYSASTENATWESPAPHVAREFAIRVLWPAVSATWRAAPSPTLTPGLVLYVSGDVKYD